ncbi:MAG: BadF/BadG/BcrA/BcrD ATPase family protein [Clostridiaceae bacterium]|nr:BadF/BadG/BcrA/BcrD ATPase family protein [Clostridiaceae bacterium]
MKRFNKLAAIDGGGTKTEFVLLQASGDVLKRIRLGASNPFDIGFDRTAALLREGIDFLLKDEDGLDALFAGLSGGASGDSTEKLRDIIRAILPDTPCDAGSDMVNAIASGSLSGDGCAVIAGTGSSAFARVGGVLTRCGGWGYLFDGAGSGYDLGAGAITHTLRVHDGRAVASPLSVLTEQALGGSAADQLTDIYAKGKRYIASFAPAVFAAYDTGDPAAAALLDRTCAYLAEIISTAARRAGLLSASYDASAYDASDVVCIGGLWNRRDILVPRVTQQLPDTLRLIFPEAPPVFGAAAEAARLASVSVTESFRNHFLSTWRV